MNHKNMSITELEQAINQYEQDMEIIREKKRAAAKALDHKIVLEEAMRKLATMSDAERGAIMQTLRPDGIQSQEQHGIIGRLLGKLRGAPG